MGTRIRLLPGWLLRSATAATAVAAVSVRCATFRAGLLPSALLDVLHRVAG